MISDLRVEQFYFKKKGIVKGTIPKSIFLDLSNGKKVELGW